MASTFRTGYAGRSTPYGLIVNLEGGQQRLVTNALNKRINAGAEVLIARNETSEKVIARRYG